MAKIRSILFFLGGLLITPTFVCAQEKEENEIDVPESSEVFLEEYSDAFQEIFFEALKQKGIENYERAINLLLECKLIDEENSVIDHELAKAYLADKQYGNAQEYGIAAIISEPQNRWYLNTLVEILQKQGSTVESVQANIPFKNNKLKENLALIYFKQKNYEGALTLLRHLAQSSFTENLSAKIKDSLEKKEEDTSKLEIAAADTGNSGPFERYEMRIKGLIATDSITPLETLSAEAMESYPSQPYFYFANGYALNKMGNYQEAIDVLESALDYLLNDTSLSNKIYKELVDAYTALNNLSMANMYLRKIKAGF